MLHNWRGARHTLWNRTEVTEDDLQVVIPEKGPEEFRKTRRDGQNFLEAKSFSRLKYNVIKVFNDVETLQRGVVTSQEATAKRQNTFSSTS